MTHDEIKDEALSLISTIDPDRVDVDKLAIVRAAEAWLVSKLATSVAAKRAELAAIEQALSGAITSQAAPVVDPRAAMATREDVHKVLLSTHGEARSWAAREIAKAIDIDTSDVSAALAWLSRHGKARTVAGTRGWVAVDITRNGYVAGPDAEAVPA